MIYAAKVKTREVEILGKIDTILDEANCGKCRGILYGYDETICPTCGAENSFIPITMAMVMEKF